MFASPMTHDAYTVDWICALSPEAAAATAMLYKTHPNLSKPDGDKNTYILGDISGHNVDHLGIGDVPNTNQDIRLEDIVVSKPTGTFGGVIQYDYGKTVCDGKLQKTGMLK
ncbi:hypothetical protein EMCG_00912 [[Emmonsia] crescens]|uniref:Uncharacterized protein n=1 Tax=[Emmonsia] crescens TaxID=73230 RepID=A0A0G2HNS4_9EURO|nr:hypothetical protein EMCG_00912 [Emmonsia crescens UAMH 3008]